MKGPAGMKTHFSQLESRFIDPMALKRGADPLFTLLANFEIAAVCYIVTLRAESKWPHLQRSRLKRNPRGDGFVRIDRPVVLVRMPRRDPAASFLVGRLIMINADAGCTHQLRRNAAQFRAAHKLPHHLTLWPQVLNLKKCAMIQIALLQWQMLTVQLLY